MFAKQISVQKSEANWEELISLAHNGVQINIMQGDETIAKIVSADTTALQITTERILGAHPGAWISEDFDAPLGDEFWLGNDA